MIDRRGLLALMVNSGACLVLPAQSKPEKGFPPREYQGKLATGETFGLQVAPTTSGRIAVHAYSGGLPGMGCDGLWEQILKGKVLNGEGEVLGDGGGWSIKGHPGELSGTTHRGVAFTAKPVERPNPALGAKPPTGARVLFDGTQTQAWKNAKVDGDGFLQVGAETVDKFRDFSLHIEFRLPFLPDKQGQNRANSGVYLQQRYEIQILDSFALPGKKNECGSIYEFRPPDVNACLPPGVWQCYDIEFRAARFDGTTKVKPTWIKVIHNGIIVQNGIEMPKQTGYGRKEGPEPGPIHLQNHGSPVVFRNIWILERNTA